MSEHAWVIDNLAAYVAGGLDAEECERVDVHVASCEPCAAALQDARAFDHGMESLFASTRPAPALEDRIIQVFRATSRPRSQPHWGRKLAWGAAATVALGATGAGVSYLSQGDGLRFPGALSDDQTTIATNNLRAYGVAASRSIREENGLLPYIEQDNLYNTAKQVESQKHAPSAQDGAKLDNTLSEFYPPAMALVVEDESKIHSRLQKEPENRPVQVQDGTSNTVVNGQVAREEVKSEWKRVRDPKTQFYTVPESAKNVGDRVSVFDMQNNFNTGRPNYLFFGTSAQNANGNNNGNNAGNNQGGFGGQGGGVGGGGLGGMMGGPPAGMMGGGPGMMGGAGMGMMGGGQSAQKQGGGRGPGAGGGPPLPTRGFQTDGRKVSDKEDTGSTARTPPPATTGLGTSAGEWKDAGKPTDGLSKSSTYSLFVPDQHRAKLDTQKTEGKELKDGEKTQVASSPQRDSNPGTGLGQGQADPKKTQPPQEQVAARKVIRSGDIEFEVKSFDSAQAAVTELVTNIKGAFVATVNSDKLPNGKVRGSLVVRVPPDALDSLVLALRKELGKDGELKGLKIGSQDITKQYYDLESRLKAAKTMQERLLKIIADGKGEIKQLLEAEKELGVWRTKIEEFEGEIRYYNSVVSLSTLNVVLAEKEIRAAVDVVEREMVETGIEVEDVDKAREATLTAVAEAKGRVTKAELKQFAAGQYNATLNFEVPADKAGAIRDRLRQIGTMVRLEINRTVQAEGGQATRDAKIRRGDAVFAVSIYNVTGMGVRETTNMQIAAADVPVAYRGLLDAVSKVKGRVITGQLNEQDPSNVTATLEFEVRRADDAAIQAAITAAGETVSRNVSRAAANQNLTDAKVKYQVNLRDVSQLLVRETTTLALAAPDVTAAYKSLQEVVAKVKGRVVKAQLNENDRNNIRAEFSFEVRRADEAAVQAALAAGGEVITRAVARSDQKQDVTDSRVRYETRLFNAAAIDPRETTKLLIVVDDVEAKAGVFAALVKEAGGRIYLSDVGHEAKGSVEAKLGYDVPLNAAPTLIDQLKRSGTVRAQGAIRNPQAPDGKLATARINLTLVSTDLIVPQDNGLWPQIRNGLSTSARFLLFSLSWIIFGVLVVLPWALLAYGAYRLGRRLFAPTPAMSTPSSTPSGSAS
jgi:hypothetical protein